MASRHPRPPRRPVVPDGAGSPEGASEEQLPARAEPPASAERPAGVEPPAGAEPQPPRPPADPNAGRAIVLVDVVGTSAFVVTAVLEAILLQRWTEVVGVTVALVLFVAGCLAFLLAYAGAIRRSRQDEIAVAALFLLAGPAVPRPVKLRLGGLLAVQVVVALVTALVRSFSPLAFGVLVPVFGVGLNGLWAARYGAFPPRQVRSGPRDRQRADHQRGGEMGQNAGHG
jgi:hypothetical protein